MRITAIEIENFKAIGARRRIEFAPMTILVGPNSAGKSTIIQALRYFGHLLSSRELDLFSIDEKSRARSFLDLVHGHAPQSAIRIKLDCSVLPRERWGLGLFESYGKYSRGSFWPGPFPYSLKGESEPIGRVSVEIQVRWDSDASRSYVAEYEVCLNGDRLAKVACVEGLQLNRVIDLNLEHPLLSKPTAKQIDHELLRTWGSEHGLRTNTHLIADADPSALLLERPAAWVDGFEEEFEIAFQLREMIWSPIAALRKLLSNAGHVGPWRDIPHPNFSPQDSSISSRWYRGLSAWDLLHSKQREDIRDEANKWLFSGRLATSYKIVLSDVTEVRRVVGYAGHQPEKLSDLTSFDRGSQFPSVQLIDTRTGTIVQMSDVGTGIAQILPIVVACTSMRDRLSLIEQPELHVHPALQVRMGDLLLSRIDSETGYGQLVAETHSEQIILRILRRIRENSAGKHNPDLPKVNKDDVIVIYADAKHGGSVEFTPLRISEDGDFIDRWPNGFFDERDEELF